jgi:hypothetical protein
MPGASWWRPVTMPGRAPIWSRPCNKAMPVPPCLLGEMTLKGQGGIAADQAKAAQLFQLAQSRNTICFTAGQ